MVDIAERTWFCPQVETSHSDESFIDNSYSSNSGDNCVPDILGIRHVHEMKSNPALHAAKKLRAILGTVTECRGASDSCSLSEVVGYTEEVNSLDYSASLISHKHKRRKKSKQLTKSDTLSDADEADSLDSSMLVSSHKHKKKKKSRKFIHSDTLSNMDETKSLNCSVLVSSNKHGKHKRRKICETLSDVTRWVQDNVDGSNSPPQHIPVPVNSHKHKKKDRKLTEYGVKQVVDGPDCSDSQSLIDSANSNKNRKKSRKCPQSDTAEETDSINFSDGQSQRVPVSVSSHKHKRTNTCQTLSDVIGWIQEDSIDYNHSQSVIDSVTCSKSKKKSRKCPQSDTSPNMEELDNLNYNDSQLLVDSMNPPKSKKKSRKCHQSDTLSDVHESDNIDSSDPHQPDVLALMSLHKHMRTKKSRRLAQFDTLSNVEELDSVDCTDSHLASVSSRKLKKTKKSGKLPQSDILSDVTDWVQEADSIECNDTRSLTDSVTSPKNKKKSRKCPQSDTVSNAEETDSINFSDGQSQRVPVSVSSHKHKKTNTCQTLSDMTGWIQEDNIDCNHSQSVIGSMSCPKSKKKSRKCPQSDTSPNMEELDNIKYNDSQLLVDSVTPPKSKKKSRKCHQSDTLSDVHESDNIDCSDPHQPDVLALMSLHKHNRTKKSRRLAQFDTLSNVEELGSVDCTDSHLASVSSRKLKKTKKSRKLPQSDILSDVTAWVQEADSFECNDTRSLTDSVTSPKNKSTKCAQSDTLPNVQEPDSINCTDSHPQGMVALVSSYKHKRTKKSRKYAQSDILSDVTDWAQEQDSLTCSVSQSSHVLDPVPSLKKSKKKSRKLTKSDTLSDVEDTDGLPPASVSTHKHKRKNKSRNLAKPETMFDVMRCTDEESSMDDSQSQQFLPFGSPPKASRKQKSKQPPDTKLTERTESSERMEQDKTAQHEITEGNPPMSDDDTFRKCNEMDQNGDRDEDSASARHSHAEPDHSDNDINSLSGAEDPASANDLHAEARSNDSVPARTACRTYRHALHRDGASQATSVLHSDSVTSEQRYTYLRRNRVANELEKPLLVQKLRGAADDDKVFADILHTYETNVSYEWFKDTAQLLQAEGLSANRKKWSVNEDKQLKANWESFHQEYPDAEVNKLLCCSKCSPAEKKAIGRMIVETQFYKKLGENIRRHLCQIYNRARAILIQRPKR
ncbi:hypothetical protein LSAT2_022373 [Lamellibrachia satsuma]|nr:hypothetical protein LSAT2_022373 [Lamellibrachia satsuma]